MKLFPSERTVMELLWDNGIMRAADIAKNLSKSIGWNRNTTYTVIKKCISKGAIERMEPHFLCKPLICKEEVAIEEATEMIEKRFDGSFSLFVSMFSEKYKLSDTDIIELQQLIDDYKNKRC